MTLAIIGCGLAAVFIGFSIFAAWAIMLHDEEYQEDYHAGEENMGDW